MTLFGKIVVIKRNGTDGISFPLTASSCLFGRRTECDIRIQLPQVSKEHCKIEVNENKEAILTNLSTVNPTQLNGAGFEQPVPLKHGDVVTIIDRSFRFEYPLQATPRKRRSRSPKDETLQVLHVQQVAEVELQTSGSKNLHASDNAECKAKDADENKQSTEENISKALPVKVQTPKSSHRIDESAKEQNSVSPFSKLYQKLKNEIKVKKPLPGGNATQEGAKGDGKSVPLEPSTQISLSGCVSDLGNLSKEQQERGRSENYEVCKVEIKQDVVTSEFNQVSAVGSATKKSFVKSPRTSISKVSRDTGERSRLQDHKEPSTAGKSGHTEFTTKPSQEEDGSAVLSLKQCSIECLDYAGQMKMHSPATALHKPAQPGNTANVSEVDQCVLSTPTSRRKSPRSNFVSPTRESSGMNSVITDTPTPRRRVSLKRRSLSGAAAKTQREDSLSISDSFKQLPLAENKCLKQRRSSKQHTPGKHAEALREICDQANVVNSKEEHSEPPACSNSRSPRRNNRESQELSNRSVHLETLASEEFTSQLASPASHKCGSGRKRGRPRRSGLLTGKPLETNAPLEHHDKPTDGKDSEMKEELATKEDHQEQGLEVAGVTRPCRLSSKRRSSGGTALLKDTEAVSEMNISDLLDGEESGKTTKMSLKRKSGEVLLQPLGKRKRVSFGGHLSPELFDKSLPPNSPLKRGAIPARLSLPFGNSPRAVLKKAQGLKHFAVQEVSEHLQKEKLSPKNLPAQKSPSALSPSSGRATPKLPPGSPAPYKKGRFSVSHIMAPLPIVEERDAVAEDMNTEEDNGALVKTPKSLINQNDKPFSTATPEKRTRSAQLALKVTPMKSRSGAVAVFTARRSGASSANLLVAKSWAEVVKSGAARPQAKAVKKSVRKGRLLKKTTQSPKTPESNIRGHFSTGHAESPATIVVGRAYSTTVRTSGHVPKVMKNPVLKLNVNADESFTGMAEMFQTPENLSGKTLPLAAVQKMDFTPTCAAADLSELHTPEETGEMMVSPLNSSDASEQEQDSADICHFLREESPLKSVFDAIATKTPEKRNAMPEENTGGNNLSATPEKQASQVKSGSRRRTPKEKLEPVEVMSGVKQLLRTPEQRSEPVEALSGMRQLMKTPKQTSEPVEALSGIKQLMKTPKQESEPVEPLSGTNQHLRTPEQKLEPVEVLSGIKQLMRTPKRKLKPVEALSGIRHLMKTPKQKVEPVEALSGIRQLMKTPKQKVEPVEALSGIRQLMKTPKQKVEPVEALSGIRQLMKTPKQKVEPVEALSGIRQLMKTPKQKVEPVEALSGIRHLMKTPKQKVEPVEALSGIRQLMKTPKQKVEPVEALSGIRQLLRTPKQQSEPVEVLSGIKQLLRTPQQKPEPVEVLSGIKLLMKTPQQELEPVTDESAFKRLLKAPVQNREAVTSTKKAPKMKYQPVEDMIGVSRIFKTPKDKAEPTEDVFDISRLMKTPREKYQPVDDFVGLQRLMAEPRQKCSDSEVDYAGVMEMFDAPEETEVRSVKAMHSKQEDTTPFCTTSSHKHEDRGNISQGEDSQQKESASAGQSTQRRRGRPRKAVHPASAEHCRRELNLKELQSVEEKSTQEEMEAEEGQGRRTNHHIQEETVSEPPEQEKVDIVSCVEPQGAAQRPRRGKRKGQKELKHLSENPETCDKHSSVLQEEKQILQECGVSDIVETEDGPIIITGCASSSPENESCQLQTGLKETENKSNEGGVEDSEEMFLSPKSRVRRVRKVASPEPLIPPKRGRRARNDQVQQAASETLHRTTGKDPSEKMLQKKETFVKDTEAAAAKEPENGNKLEIKIPQKRGKFLRSAGKYSTEVKADIGGMTLENIQTIQKTEETSAEAVTEPIKNEIKASQGDETENAQENTTEASQKLKAESPSGETNRRSVTGNRSTVKETTRTRNRRGKKDSLEKKSDEFAKDVKNLELIAPKIKIEAEVDESSLKDSVGSVCVKNTYQVMKDQDTPTAPPEPAADSDGLAQSRPKRARNDQGVKTTKQTETLQENQAHNRGLACTRGRGRKVNFALEEASSKAVGGSSLPEDGKGMTDEESLQVTSENPSSQVRRSRRKQADTIPRIACSTLMEKQTITAELTKDEASTKEQDSALDAAPSSTEDIPLRRGRRREVAAASQTSRSLSTRRRCGLLEGNDKKMTVREDQNPALGNETLQAKANASARDEREKIDLAAEAKSSSPLQRQCGFPEVDGKEEGTCEEQNVPLETVSCAKEKPLGRGRRKQTALSSHTASYIPLRGKRGLPADNGSKEAPKEDQNVSLETSDSSIKQNQLRKSRRKETALLLEATSSASLEGKQGLAKESGRKTNHRGAKKLLSENSTSQEKIDPSKGNSRETITTQAVSSTSLQALPEEGKSATPEQQQSVLLEVAPSVKENPSRVGRKRTTSSTSKETRFTSLWEKPVLPKVRGQRRILKEGEGTSLENNSSQENTRKLRNKSKKVEFKLEAAASTSHCKDGDLPENGKAPETQEMCLTSAGSEGNHQPAKEEGITPAPWAAPRSRNRKRQLSEDDLPTKIKSENDGNPALQKGKRIKAKEEPEGDLRATRSAGGTDRKTRSSTRTSAKARK